MDWVAASSPLAKQQEAAAKNGRVNVALAAKPSTTFVSGHETLDAVNDGFKPANSNDKRCGAYGNWPKKGSHWVQYEWSAHERVGTNLISPKDYHGNPSILIDREGFLHVFYGGHNKKMRYSRSSKPLSNDDWQDYTSHLPYTDSTYPQLFVMSDGTICSFYRRKTHRGNWSYVTSKDNGRTWSKEVHVLDGRSPPGNGWYAAFTKDPNRDHIHLMFLWHASKDNLPNSRRNLYYMQMDHSTGKWTSMENEKLNTPLSFEEANESVMIFDSKNKYSSIPQLWLTFDGRPVGLNRISEGDGAAIRHLHVWTGETWRTQKC